MSIRNPDLPSEAAAPRNASSHSPLNPPLQTSHVSPHLPLDPSLPTLLVLPILNLPTSRPGRRRRNQPLDPNPSISYGDPIIQKHSTSYAFYWHRRLSILYLMSQGLRRGCGRTVGNKYMLVALSSLGRFSEHSPTQLLPKQSRFRLSVSPN